MRTQEEIMQKTEEYRQRLAWAVEQQALYPTLDANRELAILALVDKLEILFWILEIDLPGPDVIDALGYYYN